MLLGQLDSRWCCLSDLPPRLTRQVAADTASLMQHETFHKAHVRPFVHWFKCAAVEHTHFFLFVFCLGDAPCEDGCTTKSATDNIIPVQKTQQVMH